MQNSSCQRRRNCSQENHQHQKNKNTRLRPSQLSHHLQKRNRNGRFQQLLDQNLQKLHKKTQPSRSLQIKEPKLHPNDKIRNINGIHPKISSWTSRQVRDNCTGNATKRQKRLHQRNSQSTFRRKTTPKQRNRNIDSRERLTLEFQNDSGNRLAFKRKKEKNRR